MSERKKIEDKLRRKEQEITTLEDKIKDAKVYVKALRDVLKMLATTEKAPEEEQPQLKAGSAVAQARDAILLNNQPLHIDEILSALGKENTRESKSSLTSSLAAYVRREELFTRPAPNTFGLVELGHKTVESVVNEPPSGFGAHPEATPTASDDDEIPF